jgi:CRISPR-associated protein Cmr3
MTVRSHLALLPRDGFFCKDRRGWHTSTPGRGHALEWPWPSTILGALRTASGRATESGRALTDAEWQEHARGVSLRRLLALRRQVVRAAPWGREHRVWPAPADALWLEGKTDGRRLQVLLPQPSPTSVVALGRRSRIAPQVAAETFDRAREALWWPRVADQAKPLPAPRWWSEANFVAWLAAHRAAIDVSASRWAEKPLRRVQVRVGIDPDTFTATESVLFSHDVIETLDRLDAPAGAAEWAIGAEVELPAAFGASLLRLGSDSRVAHVESLSEDVFAAPPRLIDAFHNRGGGRKGLRLVVVTPAKFQNGWLPSGFTVRDGGFCGQLGSGISGDLRLRAAFVPRPLHVSGWNVVGGGNVLGGKRAGGAPKETSRMVPAGAVFFFERLDGRSFDGEDARKLWLAALGARTDEGFGRVVPGIWDLSEQGPRE